MKINIICLLVGFLLCLLSVVYILKEINPVMVFIPDKNSISYLKSQFKDNNSYRWWVSEKIGKRVYVTGGRIFGKYSPIRVWILFDGDKFIVLNRSQQEADLGDYVSLQDVVLKNSD